MDRNKPVAWFLKYKDETYVECPSSVVGAIPLYTHPVKKLTDEEIIGLWNDLVDRTLLRKNQEK